MDPSASAAQLNAAVLCAFQEAREAFFLIRPDDQRILEANPAAERATGMTAEELRERPLTDLFAAGVPSALSGSHVLILQGNGRERVPVRLRIRPVLAGDETLGLAIVERLGDTTLALDESEERFRQLAERIDVVLWFTALEPMRILYVNPAFERVWGVTAEELYRDPLLWQKTIHPDDRRSVIDANAEWLAGKRQHYDVEYRIVRPDGSIRWIDDQAVQIRNKRGVVHRLCGVARDVTEHRKAESAYLRVQKQLLDQQTREKERVQAELDKVKEELVRQTRMATLGRMSASVAHDLRNPLGAVRNAAFYLRRKVPPTESKWADYLALIDRETVVCDQIISNMLELSRSKDPVPERIDLGDLARKAFDRARPTAGVRFVVRAEPDPFFVWADSLQLRQVFDNLIKNALEALAGLGDILVDATVDGENCIILFSDSGPGVAPEARGQLFEPLYSTKAKGTGLGLWICRQVVERHGGTMELVDVPGRGFALRICLRHEPAPLIHCKQL
jgi:PAS domain S-box-containing protein